MSETKTIKIKSVMEQIVETDIELPHYRKNSNNFTFYKVYNEHSCICVMTGDYVCEISLSNSGRAFNNPTNIVCTEEEYKKAFDETTKKLKSL